MIIIEMQKYITPESRVKNQKSFFLFSNLITYLKLYENIFRILIYRNKILPLKLQSLIILRISNIGKSVH